MYKRKTELNFSNTQKCIKARTLKKKLYIPLWWRSASSVLRRIRILFLFLLLFVPLLLQSLFFFFWPASHSIDCLAGYEFFLLRLITASLRLHGFSFSTTGQVKLLGKQTRRSPAFMSSPEPQTVGVGGKRGGWRIDCIHVQLLRKINVLTANGGLASQ